MDAYERIIMQMRKNGAHDNVQPPMIGLVMDDGKIKIDNLTLTKDDYLIDCNLRIDDKKKRYYHNATTSSGEYVSDSSHNSTLKEYTSNIIKEGDKVIMLKLTGINSFMQEQYILLAKVVKPE